MARKKSQSKSKKPIDLTKGRKPITEEDVELYDGPTRGKRGFKLEPDFTPAATFPGPIDPVEKRMFPGSLKNAKIKRQGGEERARRSKERFAERENRRRQAGTRAGGVRRGRGRCRPRPRRSGRPARGLPRADARGAAGGRAGRDGSAADVILWSPLTESMATLAAAAARVACR